ncbi:MAG TPA: hypothetical protein VGT99_01005 [Gammaproteobacteria bacterium]|nr:hypothetical protein [Gammaproteobacteria bacterium]
MNLMRKIALSGLASLCFGCASGLLYLDRDVIQTMNAGSVSVIYIDPVNPVTVLRYGTGDSNAYGGGASGALVSEINAYAGANGFEGRLALHADEIAKFDVINRNYDAIHAALMTVPSLQQAKWQRLSQVDAGSSLSDLAANARTHIVVIVHPQTMIYANVDPLAIRCRISIYQASANFSGNRRVAENAIDGVAPLGPDGSDSLPNPVFNNQYLVKGPELEQRIAALFANDGAEFQQAYAQALSELKPGLSSYFMGKKMAGGN